MESKIITNLLSPIVENNLKKSEIDNKLKKGMSVYFDKNISVLSSSMLDKRLLFTMTDQDIIAECSGISDTEIKQTLEQSPHIENKNINKFFTVPINIRSTLMIRYFLIKKDSKMLDPFLLYYTCYIYGYVYSKYFRYEPQEKIMAYTINNLSNKFKLKQSGTLMETLKYYAMKCLENYKERLIEGTDKAVMDFIMGLETRINFFVQNIRGEFEKNYQNKNYLNSDSDSYDEDNYHTADNISFQIQNLVQKINQKLYSYGANMEIIHVAAKDSEVSENEIRNVVNAILNDPKDRKMVDMLIEDILTMYLTQSDTQGKKVNSKFFIKKMLDLYKGKYMVESGGTSLKSLLEEWLTKYSVKYRSIKRPATQSAFKKALYLCFIMEICYLSN